MLTRMAAYVLWFWAVCGVAQTAAPDTIHLDAVSIKENRSGEEKGYLNIPPGGSTIRVTNSPMFRIVGFAYNKQRNDLIEGLPEWTREARWDVEVKVSEESSAAFRKMTFEKQAEVLQQILRDRCGLVAHTGVKEVPVYALMVAKTGPKMKQARADQAWDLNQKAGAIEGKALSMELLVYALTKVGLERQVVDRTGLTGRYDLSLTWTPDEGDDAARISIFTALQEELGLKLEATRAKVDAVFVTEIHKPSAN